MPTCWWCALVESRKHRSFFFPVRHAGGTVGRLLAVSLSSLGYGTGCSSPPAHFFTLCAECGVSLVVLYRYFSWCELEIPLAAVQVFLVC